MDPCDIVAEALEIEDTSERGEFVEKACSRDQALADRVHAMLKFHESNHDFLAESSFDHELTMDRFGEGVGMVIDRYKLLEVIGEGGFGTVHLAEQTEPVSRKVALKIIKLGMDTRQVVARFEAERQTLAMMDHPNIAQVLDAGATESGRPYFVMELVNGVPITEFCDTNCLSISQRLRLFADVCRAVHHAHQKGIIHRDIKPSNILVSLKGDVPVPKVIDFGVAKAIDQKLVERTMFTHFGQMIGTPQYMSPEQAKMSVLDVDTRSDVYSLGVVLFELLTGSPPLKAELLRAAGFDEMRRLISDEEPPTPSSAMSTAIKKSTSLADQRSTGPSRIHQLIQGDLDWISMKCLSKDPDQRYASATDIAVDIERHLANEPVLAGPPSNLYRLRKFVRRHRGYVVGGMATTAAFLAGLAFTIVALMQTQQALSASEATMGLFRNLVARIDPSTGRESDYSAVQLFDDFAEGMPSLEGEPEVETSVRLIIGEAYNKLGESEKSFEQLMIATELQQESKLDIEAAKTLVDVASGSLNAGRYPRNVIRALQCSSQAVVICDRLGDSSETMLRAHTEKSFALLQLGQVDEAKHTLDTALQAVRNSGRSADEPQLPIAFSWLKMKQGKYQEAVELVSNIDDSKVLLPQEGSSYVHGCCLLALGEFDEAEAILREELKSTERKAGTYAFGERRLITAIADCMRATNRHAEAANWLDQHLDAMTDTTLAWLLPDWTIAQLDLGRYQRVDEYCRLTVQRLPDSGEALNTRVLASTFREMIAHAVGSSQLAELARGGRPLCEQALRVWPDDFGMQLMLAWNIVNHRRPDAKALARAESTAKQAVTSTEQASTQFATRDFRLSFPSHVLARVKAAQGDFVTAAESETRAIDKLSDDHWFLRTYYERCLAEYLVASGDLADAEKMLVESIQVREQAHLLPEMRFHIADARLKLAEVLKQKPTADYRARALNHVNLAIKELGESANAPSKDWAERLLFELRE